jgi:cob(I)alamin adenosyltransferase
VRIYTKTGDAGETSLFDGTRVRKCDERVAAYGDVDELNAVLGVARAALGQGRIAEMVERVQRDLFALGSALADPAHRIAPRVEKAVLGPSDVERLEEWIDLVDRQLPPLRRFLLPGGTTAGAALHLARTVCRRAERRVVSLGEGAVDAHLLAYVNRLSDLLFVLARAVNLEAAAPEAEW